MRTDGHTLLELSIVLAVMVILVSLVIPNYQHLLRHQYRQSAVTTLYQLALQMADGQTPHPPPMKQYQFNWHGNHKKWHIIAQPIANQQKDSCGRLTLNQLGQRHPTRPSCWQ